jgi:hypothetical protein
VQFGHINTDPVVFLPRGVKRKLQETREGARQVELTAQGIQQSITEAGYSDLNTLQNLSQSKNFNNPDTKSYNENESFEEKYTRVDVETAAFAAKARESAEKLEAAGSQLTQATKNLEEALLSPPPNFPLFTVGSLQERFTPIHSHALKRISSLDTQGSAKALAQELRFLSNSAKKQSQRECDAAEETLSRTERHCKKDPTYNSSLEGRSYYREVAYMASSIKAEQKKVLTVGAYCEYRSGILDRVAEVDESMQNVQNVAKRALTNTTNLAEQHHNSLQSKKRLIGKQIHSTDNNQEGILPDNSRREF